MKPSRAFWGVFFVVLGILFLVGRNYDIHFGWDYVWKFWPLMFVLIGLAMMLKIPRAKWVLAGVAAIGVAFFAYGVISFAWIDSIHAEEGDNEVEGVQVQEFSEPLSSNIKKASFTLDAAAGRYAIESTTQELFTATTRSVPGRYTLERESIGDEANLHLKMDGDGKIRGWRIGRFTNRADIKLSTVPVWDLDFNIGAAKADLDLSALTIENMNIEAGAATVKMKLGMPSNETRVKMESGASTIKISIPEAAGCEIRVDGGLSSKRFEDFRKIDGHTYRTENFEQAAKKIFIDAEAGVSSIRVVRY